jgi:outer membrane protein TolC
MPELLKLHRHFLLMPFILFSAFFMSLHLVNSAHAIEPVSLKEAIEVALQNNHEVVAFRSSLLAQKEDIGIARSDLLPKLTFEERFLRTNNPTYVFMSKLNQGRFTIQDFAIDSLNDPSPESDFQTSIGIFQPLLARQANIGVDMSETAYAAKEEDYYRKQEETAMQVSKTYLMVQMAQEFITVSENRLEDALEGLRIAEISFKNRLGLYADTLRASTGVTEAEQKLITARKNLKVAERALGLQMGLTESVQTTSGDTDIMLHDLEYYSNSARIRPDIKSMELKFQNAQNSLKMSEAAYIPTLGMGSSYQLNDHEHILGSEGQSWQVFAALKWDIFDGLKRKHEKQKAHHQIAETKEYLRGLLNATSFKVYEAFLGVEEAQKNSELAQAALTTAEEGRRLVKIRYENGLSPLVDLLAAQVSLDQARANVVVHEKKQQLAILSLGFESGTILQDLNIETENQVAEHTN